MIHLNREAERTKDYTFAANLYFEDGERSASSVGESFPHKLRAGRSPSRARRIFAVAFSDHRNSAGHCRQSRWIDWAGNSWLRQCCANDPFARLAGITCPSSVFRDQCAHCECGPVPLRVIADRAEHCEWLAGHPAIVRESAVALGLSRFTQLWEIYLPMASRSILSGIKTSAVINIGTATLAALIGAGGLGEPILSGLNLNDHVTILEGAIPAAVLALLVQWLFDVLDRVLIPKGLRI